MSTQAPAATPSAPAAPPVEAKAPEPKKIAPIKTLPGMYDPKADDERIARGRAERAAAKAAESKEATQHLDPSITDEPSKSAEGASKAQGVDTPTEVATAASEPAALADPAKQASDAAPPEAFEFAGEKWESREKAEHAVKTLKGMHKSLVKRAEEAERKAEGWYKEAQRLSNLPPQSNQQLPTQSEKQEKAAPAASKAPVDLLLEAVDPNQFEGVWNRNENKSVPILWALTKMQKAMEARIQSILDQRVSPFEKQSKESAEAQRVVETFRQVANLEDESGDPLYPEFSDPTFANVAYSIWKEMKMDPEVAYSHKGVHAAYANAILHFQKFKIPLPSNQTTVPAKPTASTAEAVDKVAEAVAAGLNGRRVDSTVGGSSIPVNRPAVAESPEMAIRRRILAAGTGQKLPGLA